MEGVIAPVEAVRIPHRVDRGLLFFGIRRKLGQFRRVRVLLVGLVFVDGGDVKGGEQVQVAETSRGQGFQVVHPGGLFQR